MDNNQPVDKNNTSNFSKVLLLLLILLGFISSFTGGYFVKNLLKSETGIKEIKPTITLIPTQSQPTPLPSTFDSNQTQETTKFLPGKYYFDDTILIVTKDEPHLSLVATVTRLEQESNYSQNTRVSFFNGSSWKREIASKTIKDSTIVSDTLVKKWETTIDPSRVLKEAAKGEIDIDNKRIIFETATLENEMSIRSLPGYTKFMSEGKGRVIINGKNHDAVILYTRIYSLNSADIQFYSQPFGLTTDWIAFWDSNGNFYHIDATDVKEPTKIYQTHQLGIVKNANGSISKTFQVNVSRDTQTPPVKYTITMGDLGYKLHFDRIDSINKAPNNSYKWFMGNIKGTTDTNGFGIAEYINN